MSSYASLVAGDLNSCDPHRIAPWTLLPNAARFRANQLPAECVRGTAVLGCCSVLVATVGFEFLSRFMTSDTTSRLLPFPTIDGGIMF